MLCRVGCGACCVAPSISSAIPGMPNGKPAGVRCVQLDPENRCKLFGRPERPAICARLQARRDMCGDDRDSALAILSALELSTYPAS
ncbi:MAG: YkgJ family cysteine cluster protein [Rudaea sp.]